MSIEEKNKSIEDLKYKISEDTRDIKKTLDEVEGLVSCNEPLNEDSLQQNLQGSIDDLRDIYRNVKDFSRLVREIREKSGD